MKKKVLIITYYWPPSGGSGVQRWLKFVKYLRDFEYEPVVFTADGTSYPIEDASLEKEVPEGVHVIRQKIFEPASILNKSNKGPNKSAGFLDQKPSFLGRVLLYVRANYFIPDARMFWIKPSVKRLLKELESEDISLIVSTGPPHSTHLIALKLKERTGIPWIADFRDPWTEIDFFEKLPLTKRSLNKHARLEKKVLQTADQIVVIGETMKTAFDVNSHKVAVIPNGYDDEPQIAAAIDLDDSFSIAHIGLMNADRNPQVLWRAIRELSQENQAFKDAYKIQLIGSVANEVEASLLENGIDRVERIAYLPHDEVVAAQKKAQVLLLAVNNVKSAKGIITGKIFEYLHSGRPILAIGPINGDLAAILRQTEAGTVIDFEDLEGMKVTLLELFQLYQEKRLIGTAKGVERYHRRALTKDFAKLIDQVLSN